MLSLSFIDNSLGKYYQALIHNTKGATQNISHFRLKLSQFLSVIRLAERNQTKTSDPLQTEISICYQLGVCVPITSCQNLYRYKRGVLLQSEITFGKSFVPLQGQLRHTSLENAFPSKFSYGYLGKSSTDILHDVQRFSNGINLSHIA